MIIKNARRKLSLNIWPDVFVCLILFTATFAVYLQIENHELINFDDDVYVSDNIHVQSGLSLNGVSWAFTAVREATWQPLVWLSYMLDRALYGDNQRRSHLTNLFFHILNTLLLYILLKRATGALWQSGFVATLFALHPMHVESVAWMAERKDVLSAFFWMLCVWYYIRYVERPGVYRYLPALVFFILGLMAKPMLVTLPFVLILLDYWPLKRLAWSGLSPETGLKPHDSIKSLPFLLMEKLPFFVFAFASCVLTYIIHEKGGALAYLSARPINVRFANALISYAVYIGKLIFPFSLSVFYPYTSSTHWWKAIAALLLLTGISVLAIKNIRRAGYLPVGWFWYLGTLVPVIGIVQTGAHALADRFTYLPSIGLFIIAAWGIPELLEGFPRKKFFITILAASLISLFTVTTWHQIKYWSNSIKLFRHAINITSDNNVVHHTLGIALFKKGKINEAVSYFQEALRIAPGDYRARSNLGLALVRLKRTDEAILHFKEALRLKPDYADASYNLGIAFAGQGKTDEAIMYYQEALRFQPDYSKAHNNLGAALIKKGRVEEAIAHFKEALRINPDYSQARNNLQKIGKIGTAGLLKK